MHQPDAQGAPAPPAPMQAPAGLASAPEAASAPGLQANYSRLVLSGASQIAFLGPGRYLVEHALSGRGIEIDADGVALLRVFTRPALPRDALSQSPLEPLRAERLLRELRALGLLTPVGLQSSLPPQLAVQPERGLFRLPLHDPLQGPLTADFCFFGVPYEAGRTGLPGAALGPDALRDYSRNLPCLADLETGHSLGWYDYDTERLVLRGATMADAGNVMVPPGEPPPEAFGRISALVEAIVRCRAIPVGLGGDHSITAPILRGFGGRELTVVQFDAHTDLEDTLPPETLHHGNVMCRALEIPGVQGVIAMGLRGFGVASRALEEWRAPRLSASQLRAGGVPAMLGLVPPGPIYVTVDLDVLDPSFVPAVGTPLPGGLSPMLLKELLWALGRSAEVIGFDFVELSPRDSSEVSLAIAAELALTLAGAVYERLYEGPPA
jgi:agmatinase